MKRKITIIFVLFLLLSFSLLLTGCFEGLELKSECQHEYDMVSTTATCVDPGQTIYKCKICGHEVEIREMGTGHDYETTELLEPTCIKKGKKVETCKKCGDVVTTILDEGPHTYEIKEMEDSTCTVEGHKTEECSVCHDVKTTTIEKKPHEFGDWTLKTAFIDSTHNEEERECGVCHEKETRLVSTIPDMDNRVLDYDATLTEHVAKSLDEAGIIYNVAILNNVEHFKMKLDFTVSNFDDTFEAIGNLRTVPFDFHVEASYNPGSKILSLDFTYLNNPTKSTPKTVSYVQAQSANVNIVTPTRASDYDDFKINEAEKSYRVSTSEQLVYVLEHRYKPLPEPGSSAETIYNKIKTVLRQIITDDMNDEQKVKAIHDWLVLNVTYDQELVSMMAQDDIKSYDGFYLEGVFNNGYAVCDGISKAMCAMANIEGIPCVRISGHETGVTGGVGHAWNKIYVAGDWYIIDATSDGTIISGTTEILSYVYYLISDDKMATKYTGEEYTDYICSKDYDVLSKVTFTNGGNTQTFVCKNQSELNNLMDYFVKQKGSKTDYTIQLKLDFNYGISFNDEINIALLAASYSKGFSTVNNGDYLLIMLD